MLPRLFHRNSRSTLLVEINPYRVLVAGLHRTDRGPATIHCAAEFQPGDETGLRQWLDRNSFTQSSRMPTICGCVAAHGLVQRDTLQPRKLEDPEFFAALLREEYKIEQPDAWSVRIVNPLDGNPVAPEAPTQALLLCGLPNGEIRSVQQRLLSHRLFPTRLEPAQLPLFGAVFGHMAKKADKRAIVIVVIDQDRTTAFILGKEGVHTHNPIRLGFASIRDAVRAEFALPDDESVDALLRHPTLELLQRAPKFLRILGRALKPLVDSYEMSTGQPAGSLYCAYLPPEFAWLGAPLAKVVERPHATIDCNEWLPLAGLEAAPGVTPFGPHWLGALGLAARFTAESDGAAKSKGDAQSGPWHLDYKLAGDLPNNQLVGRRFITDAVAISLAAFAITITIWQLYVSSALRADTAYWKSEMAGNQALFDELTRSTTELKARSIRLDHAYELVVSPYQVSDFVLSLGRTLPPNMRIDRIESASARITLEGDLREASDQASGTLTRYLEELRNSPAIGPLFSTILLTALQRGDDPELQAFEITFRLKPAPP